MVAHVDSAAGCAGSAGSRHTETGAAVGVGNGDIDRDVDGDGECAA
ncbi:hypothetical protein [Corynebacterium propinquum]|nr:hypothetical protein [Corynebacterium propinquum]MCG7230725.1 hypothetical protein [Corynebacterium propinquum]MDK8535253.1 hypothetical protein [Corynebacterium propinquum]